MPVTSSFKLMNAKGKKRQGLSGIINDQERTDEANTDPGRMNLTASQATGKPMNIMNLLTELEKWSH